MRKVVASGTLDAVDWNAELVRGDVVDAVRRLKKQPGRGISLGGVKLPATLAAQGLIDEYTFVVHPVIAGRAATARRRGPEARADRAAGLPVGRNHAAIPAGVTERDPVLSRRGSGSENGRLGVSSTRRAERPAWRCPHALPRPTGPPFQALIAVNAADVSLAMDPVRLRGHDVPHHTQGSSPSPGPWDGRVPPDTTPRSHRAFTRGGLRDDPLGNLRPTSAGRNPRAQFFLADGHPRDKSVLGDDLERLPSFHLQKGFGQFRGEGGAGAERSVIEVSGDEDRRTACDSVLPRPALLDDELASPITHHLLQGPVKHTTSPANPVPAIASGSAVRPRRARRRAPSTCRWARQRVASSARRAMTWWLAWRGTPRRARTSSIGVRIVVVEARKPQMFCDPRERVRGQVERGSRQLKVQITLSDGRSMS